MGELTAGRREGAVQVRSIPRPGCGRGRQRRVLGWRRCSTIRRCIDTRRLGRRRRAQPRIPSPRGVSPSGRGKPCVRRDGE
jgi:hypothetical protein